MKYLIGSTQLLQSLFPNIDWDHTRKSFDGEEAVIEAELSPEIEQELMAENVLILDHQEAVEYLNDESSEGIWYAIRD